MSEPQRLPRPQKSQRRHRLSPQGTLLSLGVLLLLAAGVTFLAVTWDSLPIAAQAVIIGTLAALAFAGSIPASRRSLTGTAEALAILGCGLLTVDLYGVRALGLISPTAIDGLTYSAIVFGSLALINLLMTRLARRVVTYGVTAVIAGQLPLPLILVDRTSLPVLLAAMLAQVVITLVLSAQGTAIVRRTGAITSAVLFCGILITGAGRTFLGLVATHSDLLDPLKLSKTIATTAVVCLAAATGLVILRKRPLPAAFPWGLGEAACAAAAGFAVATCLPQLPGPGRWLTTGLVVALGVAELLLSRRTGRRALVLHVAAAIVAAVDLAFCVLTDDVRQLGYLAAITAVLAVLAAVRKIVDAAPAAGVASLAAQFTIVLFAIDEYIGRWPSTISLAVVGAAGIAIACRYVAQPLERVLISSATCAAVLALVMAATVDTDTAAGVVLTIIAAPLVAYGMNPRRRPGLLVAGLLLIIANTVFVIGAGGTTLEWYTVPPAVVMLAIGVLAWRAQPSWIYLGPGLLLGLVPSTIIADSNQTWLRVTLVVAAALATILLGTHRSLQAPFLIGAAILLTVGIRQFLDLAPLIPRWITLATAGLILLTVGATYDHRRTQAKQATHWITTLK
ncbi:SCO7613 C-terminal domain-containing membrane protein [Kribbella sp. NPDC055071]